jgi:hypothetical protein
MTAQCYSEGSNLHCKNGTGIIIIIIFFLLIRKNKICQPVLNPFQSNFSATRILPSSYLFWAGKRLVDYLSVLHEEKRRTGSDRGAGEQTQQKKCRMSSNIGVEQENHNVGQGPTMDWKGLTF